MPITCRQQGKPLIASLPLLTGRGHLTQTVPGMVTVPECKREGGCWRVGLSLHQKQCHLSPHRQPKKVFREWKCYQLCGYSKGGCPSVGVRPLQRGKGPSQSLDKANPFHLPGPGPAGSCHAAAAAEHPVQRWTQVLQGQNVGRAPLRFPASPSMAPDQP